MKYLLASTCDLADEGYPELMARVYISMQSKMVFWKKDWSRWVEPGRPRVTEAKGADLFWFKMGEVDENGLVASLMDLWARYRGYPVNSVGTWLMVRGERLSSMEDLGAISSILTDRAKDEWMIDRYQDSVEVREIADFDEKERMLMKMYELARESHGSGEVLRALCRKATFMMLVRPSPLIDEFAWRKERQTMREW